MTDNRGGTVNDSRSGVQLSDEQRTIRDTLRQFAAREIKPNSAKWDKEEIFPREVIGHLGELGFLGISFPERFGGGAADTLSQALVVEGLSRYDARMVAWLEDEIASVWLRVVLMSCAPLPFSSNPFKSLKASGRLIR